jgi:hypothetical protein
MSLFRKSPLDRAHPGPLPAARISGDNVRTPAKIFTARSDVYGSNLLVLTSQPHDLDQASHHDVVDGISLLRTVELYP